MDTPQATERSIKHLMIVEQMMLGSKSGAYRTIKPYREHIPNETVQEGIAMAGCSLRLKYGWIIGLVIIASVIINIINR